MLESYDAELAEGRNKNQYRDKGKRNTTIKTVYGEVTYSRKVYQTKFPDGKNAHVYLLDEAMRMDKIGMISTNLAEKIAMTVTEEPYRVAAETISSTCGQSISHGGAWNLVQKLGGADQRRREPCRKADGSRTGTGKENPAPTLRGDGRCMAVHAG